MTESEQPPPRRRRVTRARWWLAGMAGALLLLLIAAWFERRELAGGYIDDLLAERGVAARYKIADLGPRGQRLTDVVIGDPAKPDLTADWVETETVLGWGGPEVTAIRTGRVRLKGRVVNGQLSLGALDKLLPKSDGAPFAFPDLALHVEDGRMRLDTPAGQVGLKLSGGGHLRNGFDGMLAAVAPTLTGLGCAVTRATGYWRVVIAGAAPRLTGPTRAAALTCGDWRGEGVLAQLDARPGERLDRAEARVRLGLDALRSPSVWLKTLGGTVRTRGSWRDAGGELALSAGPSAAYGASAVATRVEGRFRIGRTIAFEGTASADRASLPARWRAALAGMRETGAGTPFGPLLDQLAGALAQAGRDAAMRADLTIASGATGWSARIAGLESRAASGARLALSEGQGIAISPDGLRMAGTLTTSGGGLPEGRIVAAQTRPGAPLIGTASFAPYRAGASELALEPVRFRATPGGNTGFTTRATLSGPLGDGRVEQASLALNGGWDGRGRLVLNPRCEAARFAALSIAGLRLDPAGFSLCPVGRALATLDNGRLGGGARIAAARLTGALGGSPLTLAAKGSELRLGDGGLGIDGLEARLGTGETPSHLQVATLTGRIAGGGITGRYAGAGGRIGAVPLVMSEAAGGWRLNAGVLSLDGGMTIADARAEAPRLEKLPVRDVTFRLANGLIDARGQVRGPDGAARVADVEIAHVLSSATGEARIAVPGVTFGPTLQPVQLTPVALGVVADVKGVVTGSGLMKWSPRGVTSSGDFATDTMDLAAAFGPVTGLKTRIHFTDLLALESAPEQVATVASVNPGVAVDAGEIRYQLLAGPKVRVHRALWPFAGGTVALEPALLDYSQPVEKRMTLRIDGLDAAVFLQRFDYKNLTATGVFDGSMPIVFNEAGGRIENGRLKARGGGTLAYVGEVSQENLGTWGNLAFDALKSLRYRELDLTLNGPLAGEIVTHARFGGVAQGEGAKSNFLVSRLAKLPFVFNVRITAPFRALLDTARSFYDPSVMMKRDLPGLIQQQKNAGQPAIQPGSSAPVPKEKPD